MTIRHIGLTGGIGSGKSTVAASWVDRGARLVDTDAIAHGLTAAGGAALPALRAEFGNDIVGADGALDRARMRQLAFADSQVRRRLEGLLHPMIGELAQQQAQQATERFVIFDVPLLGEASVWRRRCERILVVDCSEATQIERVMRRSQWTELQVRAVMAQQAPRERRRAIADAVIHNDGCSLDDLRAAVDRLWRLWSSTPPHEAPSVL
jgi:dephospho-CoA kinase